MEMVFQTHAARAPVARAGSLPYGGLAIRDAFAGPARRVVRAPVERRDTALPMARFLIVDGHAYAYRAFYAIRELRSPAGAPTNAIFGFIRMFGKMRAALAPTHAIVVWDGGLSAERTAALPEYKAQRPEMPAELVPQLDEIIRYLEAAGVASFCREGVEADDYIACLARRAVAVGWEVIIASSDKDFMQLVTAEAARGPEGEELERRGRIGLLNPHDKTEAVWTVERVREKTGVEPEQIVDWLALVGDASDNIPGVPGVGPKTAAELLRQFGSVERLYARLNEVKSGKLRAALASAADLVRRNIELVRLKAELDCEFSPEALALKSPDAARLRELFARWGFRSMLAELEAANQRALL
jgi:DNA polymerase-1